MALPSLGGLIASLQSVDLAYHLRAGSEILDTGAIPAVDAWTFSAAGTPWVDQQWGAQVVLAGVYGLGGWTGLVVLRAVLVGVAFGCLYLVGRRHGLDERVAACLGLAAFVVSAAALGLRPQLLGMVLFAVTLLLLADRRAHPNHLWAIPLIVALWANLHGSFFLAPLALGLTWLQDVHGRGPGARRLFGIAAVSAVTACLTPFGPAVWVYAVGLSMNPEVTSRITEWQPSSLRDVPGLLFFGSVAAVVVLIARLGRPTPWPTLVWLASFFVIGAYAARGIAWWPLGAVAAVAGLLAIDAGQRAASRTSRPGLRRLNAVVAVAILAAGVVALPIWRPIDPGTGAPSGVVANAPSGITAALRDISRPGDRLFNPQVWGSWFEFALPDIPVAIDSRIEFFPPDVWDAYDGALSGTDAGMEQLQAWDVTLAVVAFPNRALLDRLDEESWQSVYTDRDGWIVVSPDR
jgi:hypothetical protein